VSGIVGIFNPNGEPVDSGLLRELTAFMAKRGPDAQRTWSDAGLGFGHAMLRTTWEAEREVQPCTLDGEVWIIADARIDGREDLTSELQAAGCPCDLQSTEPELILHAYQTWGEDCVLNLIGDFAFAIWNRRTRRLFCARDHFGVKPFYYAEAAGALIFGNTLHCLLRHPSISSDLNDFAIADFLYYGLNQDLTTTSFAAIRRLPPAHTLVCSEAGLRIARYWTLPVDGPIHYRDESEYVEHFRDLLRTVVADRLRTDRVAVYMSGGLDSPGLAATARDLLKERGGPWELRAYTEVYDRLIPDEERHYAGLVARAIEIPIDFAVADDYEPFTRWDQPELNVGEPYPDPSRAVHVDQLSRAASRSRVLLFGEGPDNALRHDWPLHAVSLLRQRRYGVLIADVARYVLLYRRVPGVSSLPARLRRRRMRSSEDSSLYALRSMNPQLAAHAKDAGEWQSRMGPLPVHPVRPAGYRSMWYPGWQRMFEASDPGARIQPLEWRHPYMDVRMIRYLLTVPPVTGACHKRLLRRAFQGMLPGEVLRRPKSPVEADPVLAWCRSGHVLEFLPDPELDRYVETGNRVRLEGTTPAELDFSVRVISLNLFLKFRRANSHTTN